MSRVVFKRWGIYALGACVVAGVAVGCETGEEADSNANAAPDLPLNTGMTDVAFSPLHPQLATASLDGRVRFFADAAAAS